MSAISTSMVTITPNQIGSYPSALTTGKITGIVVTIMEKPSMNVPSAR